MRRLTLFISLSIWIGTPFLIYSQTIESRLLTHIQAVEAFGSHPASSVNEKKVAEYITHSLIGMGYQPKTIPFYYTTFEIAETSLTINAQPFNPEFMAFNPFAEKIDYKGIALCVSANDTAYPDLNGQVVVTNHPAMHFRLLTANPEMILVISADDYLSLQGQTQVEVGLEINGSQKETHSQNVELIIGDPRADLQLFATAHLDAWQNSPGANDNATGIAALLELAASFKEKPLPKNTSIRLIWLGAEEIGMAGSRHYVSTHLSDLDQCRLLINFDTLGGDAGPVIAGSDGDSSPFVPSDFAGFDQALDGHAIEDGAGAWRLHHPSIISLITSSSGSENIRDLITKASQLSGVDYSKRNLLSDHLAFAAAGVPAISIQTQKHHIHSTDDRVQNLNMESVVRCYQLGEQLIRLALQATE